MKQGSNPFNGSFWNDNNAPFDAKTIFDTLNQALVDIGNSGRYKGYKFTVKDDSGNNYPGPREYWFTEDYTPASSNWVEDPTVDGGWRPEFPEYIPEPKPYLPEQEDWSDEIEVARLNAIQEAQKIVDTHEEKTDVHNISGQIKSAA